jgi:hypothetical protein|tara:strand:+ start:233 stop:505 length:273 start_codon:yes stop_codon:yes gene_type:complete
MAKKLKKVVESKKVTAEELLALQTLQSNINNALVNLGNIEIAKYELLQDHASLKNSLKEMSATLQETYGEVNISLADGTISEAEPLPVDN